MALSRVLMTTDTVGGVWTYSMELCRELGALHVDVGLATMGRPLTREQRWQVKRLENVELFESSYRLEWMEDPWRDVKDAGEWLLRLESEFVPDVVHLNNYCHGQLPWKTPTLMVAHSDVISWFRHVKGEDAPASWDRYKKEVFLGLTSATTLVAPSRATVEDLARFYRLDRAVRVIPNGRAPDGLHEMPKERFALTVGRIWDEAKNIGVLDDIAEELEFPVLAAGNCRNPDGIERTLTSVECLGELPSEELVGYFARASIYVLPARYEPFGLSILEAAICGCALVLGDIPSLRENWTNAAVFVDPSKPEELRATLASLMDNPEMLRDLGAKSRERSRFFGSRRMASAYDHEYRILARPELPMSQEQFVRARKGL